jgi:hypothetical protein
VVSSLSHCTWGLDGAALCTPATGRVGTFLLVIILGTVIFVAAHVVAGRYAVRRGQAVHARWNHRHSPTEPTSVTGRAATP